MSNNKNLISSSSATNKLLVKQLKTFVNALNNVDLSKLIQIFKDKVQKSSTLAINSRIVSYKCYQVQYQFEQILASGFGREQNEAQSNAAKNFFDQALQKESLVEMIKDCLKKMQKNDKEGDEGEYNKENVQKHSNTINLGSNQFQNDNQQIQDKDHSFHQQSNVTSQLIFDEPQNLDSSSSYSSQNVMNESYFFSQAHDLKESSIIDHHKSKIPANQDLNKGYQKQNSTIAVMENQGFKNSIVSSQIENTDNRMMDLDEMIEVFIEEKQHTYNNINCKLENQFNEISKNTKNSNKPPLQLQTIDSSILGNSQNELFLEEATSEQTLPKNCCGYGDLFNREQIKNDYLEQRIQLLAEENKLLKNLLLEAQSNVGSPQTVYKSNPSNTKIQDDVLKEKQVEPNSTNQDYHNISINVPEREKLPNNRYTRSVSLDVKETNANNNSNNSNNYNSQNQKPIPKLNLTILPNYHGQNTIPMNNHLLNLYESKYGIGVQSKLL